MRAVKARKDRVVAQSVDSLTQWLGGLPNLRLLRGHARFTAPHEVEVGGETLRAPQIFINTGGRAVLPDWPGIGQRAGADQHLDDGAGQLPEHLLVVGGSYIGLEFAQMYRRFGVAGDGAGVGRPR